MYVLICGTIFCKNIPYRRYIGIILYKSDTGVHIRISTEVICITIDFCPCTNITCRTVTVNGTFIGGYPSTALKNTIFVKLISTTTDYFRHISVHFICARRGVAISAVYGLPAGFEDVIDGIVEIAVHFKDTGAGLIYFAAAVIGTYELIAYDCVVVVDFNLGNNGTPIHNRLTGFAIGSVFIAYFGNGSVLIENGKLCIVEVVRRGNCGEFGSYVDRACEGVTVENAVNHFTLNVYNGLIAGTDISRRIVIRSGNVVVSFIRPNAHRDANKRSFGSLYGSVSLNNYGEKLRNFVVFESRLKAVCHNRTLGFPSICGIKSKYNFQLIYCSNISNVNVYIVYRLCLCSFTGIVMTAERNCRITCNGEGSGQSCGVAEFVLDLESNYMFACNENNILCGRERGARNSSLYFNTVYVDLAGGKVESSVIGNGCRKCNLITGDSGTVFERNCGIGSRVSRSGNSGKNSVVNSGAVVESNIVDIEGDFFCRIRFDVSTKEGRCS